MNNIMTESTTALHARQAAAAIDWRGRLGWAIVDSADKLYGLAHRITDGGTPTPDTLTVNHLERVGSAIGLRVSELVRIADDRGTTHALR